MANPVLFTTNREFSYDDVNVPWENKNKRAVDMNDPRRRIRQNFNINLN
jgi:hypothetical protein